MNQSFFPYETPALRVDQPMGTFYVAVLPAELLLQVAASDRMTATLNADGEGYTLEGTQRVIQDKRLNEIADYINRSDASFPNSIILAANYDMRSGFDQGEVEYIQDEGEQNTSKVWTVRETADGCLKLTIPTSEKLAAIIDGQHRLFSFARALVKPRRNMSLLCSVFLDLPKALQAQIFATINSTQKRVDRSLTYELFGYNVIDEDERYWSPDKLAVFLTRKFGTDHDSPLQGRIMVAPKRDAALEKLANAADWRVSTAVVVDGILRLFSSNPKRDANSMRRDQAYPREHLRNGPVDRSPLRDVYIDGNDALIYKLVSNYLKACQELFWSNASDGSFIFKTIGVQAVFDILRKLSSEAYQKKDISVEYFSDVLSPAGAIDFSGEKFRNPSGSGRTIIRREIEEKIGIAR